jgi:hypothetical protein
MLLKREKNNVNIERMQMRPPLKFRLSGNDAALDTALITATSDSEVSCTHV